MTNDFKVSKPSDAPIDSMDEPPLSNPCRQGSGCHIVQCRVLPLLQGGAQQLRLRVDVEARLVQRQLVAAQLESAADGDLPLAEGPAGSCGLANVRLQWTAKGVNCTEALCALNVW